MGSSRGIGPVCLTMSIATVQPFGEVRRVLVIKRASWLVPHQIGPKRLKVPKPVDARSAMRDAVDVEQRRVDNELLRLEGVQVGDKDERLNVRRRRFGRGLSAQSVSGTDVLGGPIDFANRARARSVRVPRWRQVHWTGEQETRTKKRHREGGRRTRRPGPSRANELCLTIPYVPSYR